MVMSVILENAGNYIQDSRYSDESLLHFLSEDQSFLNSKVKKVSKNTTATPSHHSNDYIHFHINIV